MLRQVADEEKDSRTTSFLDLGDTDLEDREAGGKDNNSNLERAR
jgi:hypothetical protein